MFLTILPKSIIRAKALPLARVILILGIISLLIELTIIYSLIKNNFSKPLKQFEDASNLIADGQYKHRIDIATDDELGRMANSFNHMITEISQRDSLLETQNANLEQRVIDRTKDLEKTHQKLIESSRLAGMSQIASNVLHKIGNTLNSINISMEQLGQTINPKNAIPLKSISDKLTENKQNIKSYLDTDDQGQNLINLITNIDKNLNNRNKKLNTELDEMNTHIQKVKNVLDEQQKFAKHEPIFTKANPLQIWLDTLGEINSQIKENLEIKNAFLENNVIFIDAFKVKAIISQLLAYITSQQKQQANITIQTKIFSTPTSLTFTIKHLNAQPPKDATEQQFSGQIDTAQNPNLHYPALLAIELEGNLKANYDPIEKQLIYTLLLPYKLAPQKLAA